MSYAVRLPFLLVVVALLLSPFTTARAENAAPLGTMELEDGDTVVFLGDSITHQRLYTQYVEDFFYTRYPTKRIRFHNAGVGGAKAWDALARFDRDVAAYKPKYVTVLLGMNDGRYQAFNEEIWQTYHDDMSKLVGKIVECGATPVLMTPTMYDSRAARARKRQPAPHYNSVLTYYGTWLREVSVESGFGFVDMWGPLNNLTLQQRKTEPDFTMIKDSVHPDAPGQLVMAYALIEDTGLRGPLSNIRVTLDAKGRPQVRGAGGKASKAEADQDSVSFTWAAEGLPWVVPEEAQLGAKLLHLGHRASREALEVHGLRAGKYELAIDGEVVGTYTHVQLARHIELQGNEKTPQYKQAAEVAELNKQRNTGPIGMLRGEWSQFQRYARVAEQLKEMPDDAELAKQVAALKSRVDGMEARVVAAEKAAKEIEDRIFTLNQPPPRQYVLRRIGD